MKNQIVKTATKGKEYFGFTDTDVIVSSKKHGDINSLMGALEKKGMMETLSHIKVSDITELTYNEKGALLKIKHLKKGKPKTFKITFDDSETRNTIASSISEVKGFNKSLTAEGKMKPLLLNVGFILIAAMLAAALAGTAYEAANGIEAEAYTGRRSGLKNLLVSLSSALGPVGVGIIGALIVLYLIYNAIKRWKNPANDVLFS